MRRGRMLLVSALACAFVGLVTLGTLVDEPERTELEIESGHIMTKRFGTEVVTDVRCVVEVGSGSVQVRLFDADGYRSSRSGGEATPLFQGMADEAKGVGMDVRVDEGEYYLVLENDGAEVASLICTMDLEASRGSILTSPIGLLGVAGLALVPLELRFLHRLLRGSGDQGHRHL